MNSLSRFSAVLLSVLLAAACSPGSRATGDTAGSAAQPADSASASAPSSTSTDSSTVVALPPLPSDTTLARLEREARALAKTDGCTTADQCRVAPVGAQACGGPRYWLAYCAASTDSAALFGKLAELEAAEKKYNQTHHIVSDCRYLEPPVPGLTGGRCLTSRSDGEREGPEH
jgi:hypothetical protein